MAYKCSMQKKIESVTKRNEWYRGEHADIFDDIRRDTSNSWYIGATRMMPKKSGAVTGAIEDDDYRDRFVINFTAACDNFDFSQNSEELKELADTCLSMAITDRSPRTKGDMLVTAVPLGNPVAKGNSWNYDVELKYNNTQKGETKMTCSMQKKIESLKKKSEAVSGDIRVTDEDVMLTVNEVDIDEHGGSFSVDTPEKDKSYDLREMKDMVTAMCEDCSGYSETSRDGSDVRIAVKAPESDKDGEFRGDYYDAFVMRCTARIVHASLEGVVDYLAED